MRFCTYCGKVIRESQKDKLMIHPGCAEVKEEKGDQTCHFPQRKVGVGPSGPDSEGSSELSDVEKELSK